MKYITLALIAFVALINSELSHSVSFNCEKATSTTERIICSDPTLGKLDDVLSENYKIMKAANIGEKMRIDMIATQKTWIAKRNTCVDKKCIEEIYKNRIDAICDYPVQSGVHPDCVNIEQLGVSLETKNTVASNMIQKPSLQSPGDIDLFCSGMLNRTAGLIRQNVNMFSGDAKSTMNELMNNFKLNGSNLMIKGVQAGGNLENANKGVAYADNSIGNNVLVILQKGTDQSEAVMNCMRRSR